MADDLVERLLHAFEADEEIIKKQKNIIDDLFVIVLQHLTVECEELKPIVKKVNETAEIRREVSI